MGEAKRRKQLDPNFGKQKTLTPKQRKLYQISDHLIEKVHQCQREYQRGYVLIFPQDNIEIFPREDVANLPDPNIQKLDSAYPNDDIIIVNLSLHKDLTIVSFPWRPEQIKDGYYQSHDNVKL